LTEERETEPILMCTTTENIVQGADGDKIVTELVEGGKGEGFQTVILTKEVELVERSLEEKVGERQCQDFVGEGVVLDEGKLGLQNSGGTYHDIQQNVEVVSDESGPVFVHKEGKEVAFFVGAVDFKKVSLLKGTGSNWAFGPKNLDQDAENKYIRRLKISEVAQLDWELKSSLFTSAPRNNITEEVNEDRRKRGELSKRLPIDQALLSKSCRFAQAVRDGVGGRKGENKKKKKKGKKTNENKMVSSVESISSASLQDNDTVLRKVQNSNEVVVELDMLVESGYNQVYDKNYDSYRLEAGRLFNIGVNLGCTSYEERITMIERLIDLETKEFGQEVGLGDEEVDP
jgi:hypothetical protein